MRNYYNNYSFIVYALSPTRLRREARAPPPLSASQTFPHLMGNHPPGGSFDLDLLYDYLIRRLSLATYATLPQGEGYRKPFFSRKYRCTSLSFRNANYLRLPPWGRLLPKAGGEG